MYKILLPFPLLLCSFCIQSASCTSEEGAPCVINETQVLPSGMAYKLELREASLDSKTHGKRYPSGFWGADGDYPKTRIDTLSLELDNNTIGIPTKIFADLGNVRSAEIKENQNAVVLVLRGGKAEGEYYATYVFIEGVVRKRTVRSTLRPERVWEKTSFNAPIP